MKKPQAARNIKVHPPRIKNTNSTGKDVGA